MCLEEREEREEREKREEREIDAGGYFCGFCFKLYLVTLAIFYFFLKKCQQNVCITQLPPVSNAAVAVALILDLGPRATKMIRISPWRLFNGGPNVHLIGKKCLNQIIFPN